jgi:hypothetical protein
MYIYKYVTVPQNWKQFHNNCTVSGFTEAVQFHSNRTVPQQPHNSTAAATAPQQLQNCTVTVQVSLKTNPMIKTRSSGSCTIPQQLLNSTAAAQFQSSCTDSQGCAVPHAQ